MKRKSIKSQNQLAKVFHINDKQLLNLIKNKENIKSLLKPKKISGYREICYIPKDIKKFQSKLSEYFYPLINKKYAYAGIKGKNILSVAKKIFKCHWVIQFDIKNCYPSIKRKNIINLLLKLGFSHKYALLFSNIITYKKCLPQGSPCSQVIANIILNNIDKQIVKVLPQKHTYCRWVDDTIIGLNKEESKNLSNISKKIKYIVNKNLFQIKGNINIIKRIDKNNLLGISISKKININKEWYKKLRAQIHNLKYKEVAEKEIDSIKGKLNFLKILTIQHLGIRKYKKLKSDFEQNISIIK